MKQINRAAAQITLGSSDPDDRIRCDARGGCYGTLKGNQIMYGVCWNWIRKNIKYHSFWRTFGDGFRPWQRFLPISICRTSFKGEIYRGDAKTVCVPGLNCYSCPVAPACLIGALQAVIGSSKFKFSYYITGFLILLGVLLGRFICGFLCPFGWFRSCCIRYRLRNFQRKA